MRVLSLWNMLSVRNGVNGAKTLTIVNKTENKVSKAALQSLSVTPASAFNLFLLVLTYQLVKLSMNFISLGNTVYNLHLEKKLTLTGSLDLARVKNTV